MQNWFAKLSARGVFLYYWLTWSILFWAAGQATGSGYSFLPCLLGGALFGGVMTLLTVRRRRNVGGTRIVVEMGGALRSGILPGLIDHERWLPFLAKRRIDLVQAGVVGTLLFLLCGIYGIYLAASSAAGPAGGIAVAIAMFALALVSAITAAVGVKRIDRLVAVIRSTYQLDV